MFGQERQKLTLEQRETKKQKWFRKHEKKDNKAHLDKNDYRT